jgi:hypothetical protein
MIINSVTLQNRQSTSSSKPLTEKRKLPKIVEKGIKGRKLKATKSNVCSLPKVNVKNAEQSKSAENVSFNDLVQDKLSSLPIDAECGTVLVRFNHYNKSFPIYNGVLKWADIDSEYCISFAYSGSFVRKLYKSPSIDSGENIYRKTAAILELDSSLDQLKSEAPYSYFLSAIPGSEYLLRVEEDSVLQSISDSKPISFGTKEKGIETGNTAFRSITDELKKISPHDLQSELAKELIERRDLEDILYSSHY